MKYLIVIFFLLSVSCVDIRTSYFTEEEKASVCVDSAVISGQVNDSVVDIDLSDLVGNTDLFNINNYIDTIKFVFFDDLSEDALIGNIEKIIVSDRYIYIMDRVSENGVVIFDVEGHFVTRIDRGEGPGEISQAYDIVFDEYSRHLIVKDPRGLIFFNETGEYIEEERPPLQFSDFECARNGYLCYQHHSSYNDHLTVHSKNAILFVDKQFKLKWSALPHYNYTPLGMNDIISHSSDCFLYTKALNDTIYGLDTNVVYAKYVLNLGTDKLPFSFLNDKDVSNIEVFDRQFRSTNYTYLESYLETSTHQAFRIGNSKQGRSFVFRDKYSGNVVGGCVTYVNQQELPMLFDPFAACDDWFVLPYVMHGVRHFSSPLISETYNEYLSRIDEESNPVLILYKLKHF